MSTKSNKNHDGKATTLGRREFVIAGAALAVAPLVGGATAAAQGDGKEASLGTGPFKARAYGTAKPDAPLGPIQIERKAVGPNDVLLDVLFCGICHSDIHQARNDWSTWNA